MSSAVAGALLFAGVPIPAHASGGGLASRPPAAGASGLPAPAPRTPARPAPGVTAAGNDAFPGTPPGAQAAMSAALDQARRTGRPVPVDALTTETTTVSALPRGGFSLDEHLLPQRARSGAGWTAIDTTLRAGSDGRLAPAALPFIRVTFSGGGGGPLVTIADGGSSLSLSWPAPLPPPQVAGAIATYPDVLPGVDLAVAATDDGGFSDSLVVKTAAGARNPGLASLALRASGAGLHLAGTAGGALMVEDAHGQTLLAAQAPQMWDSSASSTSRAAHRAGPGIESPTSTLAGPAAGAHVARVATKVSGETLTLVPDAGLLSSGSSRFPVFIDPTFHWWGADGGMQHWDEVQSACPDAPHFGSASTNGASSSDPYATLGVGYDDYAGGDCNGSPGYARDYYQVAVPPPVWHANLNSATIKATQMYTASCSQTANVSLSWTRGIWPGTDWNNQPPTIGSPVAVSVGPNPNGNCNSSFSNQLSSGVGVAFNVLPFLTGATTARSPWKTFTFRLWEPGDGNDLDWKRFARDVDLSVQWNDTPDVPTGETARAGSTSGNAGCATTPARAAPLGRTASVSGVNLWATYHDRDSDELQGSLRYGVATISNSGSISVTWQPTLTTTSTNIASGTKGMAQIPGAFIAKQTDGTLVAWQAAATDGHLTSSWSHTCYFKAYPHNPDAPYVAQGAPGQGSGACATPTRVTASCPVSVRVTAADFPQDPVSRFTWGLDTAPPAANPPGSQVAAASGGPVQGPVGRWRLNDGSGTTAADSSGYGNPATLQGGAAWANDGPAGTGTSLALDGSTGYAATSDLIVRTTSSFSVSAWVKLNSTTPGWQTAVAEAGTTVSAFYLQYDSADAQWAFSMNTTDSTNPSTIRALGGAPALGTWTHLVGVYEAFGGYYNRGTLALFVNGAFAGQASSTFTPWAAGDTDALLIGRSRFNGQPADFFGGEIADVQVYPYALSYGDACSLFKTGTAAPAAGRWQLDDGSGGPAADSSGNNRLATLSGGASFRADHGRPALALDGTTGSAATASSVAVTSANFSVSAWVYLTSTAAFNTAVAQAASVSSGFFLQYDQADNRWAFAVTTSDAANPSAMRALSTAAPALNSWVHLVGVYYSGGHGSVTLYVNGVTQSTANLPGDDFASAGPLLIGRSQYNGRPADFWHGEIADVQVYDQALTAAEVGTVYGTATITTLVSGPGPHLAYAYATDAGGNSSATDAKGFLAAGDPGATYSSFAAALAAGQSFDNMMISDQSNPGGADADGQRDSLSKQELQSIGWQPGGTVTIDGATFSLPTFGSGQPDNLLAANQTIDLPAGSQGSALVFLATSTNATLNEPGAGQGDYTAPGVPAGDSVTGTGCNSADLADYEFEDVGNGCAVANGVINYIQPASGPTLPAQAYYLHVPDWGVYYVSGQFGSNGDPSLAAATLSTVDGPNAGPAYLYAFAVPINPGYQIASVTLPDVSRFLQKGGFTPALHILGMALRNTTTATPVAGSASVQAPSGQAWTGAFASPTEWSYAPASGSWGNQTFRIALTPTASGATVRIRLANPGFAAVFSALGIGHTTISYQYGGAIPTAAPVDLTFGGSRSVTIPEGGDVYSDPLAFPVTAGQNLIVSVYLSDASDAFLPEHTWSQAQEWVSKAGSGDLTADTSTSYGDFSGSGAQFLQATNLLTGVDVTTGGEPTLGVLGDNLVDAFRAGSGTSPVVGIARAAGALYAGGAAAGYGVVDDGRQADQILTAPDAITRIDEDVLAQPGVGTVVIDEGLQDVLAGSGYKDVEAGIDQLRDILEGFGITVIVATLTPCDGYTPCTAAVDPVREQVDDDLQANSWPAGIGLPPPLGQYYLADFGGAVSTTDTTNNEEKLIAADDAGDHVNLTSAGYTAVAGTIQADELAANTPVVQ